MVELKKDEIFRVKVLQFLLIPHKPRRPGGAASHFAASRASQASEGYPQFGAETHRGQGHRMAMDRARRRKRWGVILDSKPSLVPDCCRRKPWRAAEHLVCAPFKKSTLSLSPGMLAVSPLSCSVSKWRFPAINNEGTGPVDVVHRFKIGWHP